jgi:hypothetical protein
MEVEVHRLTWLTWISIKHGDFLPYSCPYFFQIFTKEINRFLMYPLKAKGGRIGLSDPRLVV